MKAQEAHERARTPGRRGGPLSAVERRRMSRLGAQARAAAVEAARRVAENLAYADTVAILRGAPTHIVRLRTFRGPLPGIYPERRGRPRASAPRR
jgi:hypothetical protein